MSFKCSANIHTFYRFQPVHTHKCPSMTEKLCMDCVVDGHILECPFCDTELEPNRCLYCKKALLIGDRRGDNLYKTLSCENDHKFCNKCIERNPGWFPKCQTGEHTSCGICYGYGSQVADAKCCGDVCDGCDQTVNGGEMHYSHRTELYYCETCAISLGIARQG
jgi:hypothetical protein